MTFGHPLINDIPVIRFPIKLPSAANMRDHWGRRHRRVKNQRRDTWAVLRQRGVVKPRLPVTVHLTRIAPRRLDQGDNLAMALKAVRDEVAAWLGVDDGSRWVEWRYHQRKGEPKEQACEIWFEETGKGGFDENRH